MVRDKTPSTAMYSIGRHNLDKLPVTVNVSPYNQGRISGDYINIKLYLTDSDNTTKFSVETIEAMITKSSR
jgi:hypothetical protein